MRSAMKRSFLIGAFFLALAGTALAQEVPAEEISANEEKQIADAINSLPNILEIRTDFFTIYGGNYTAARRVSQIARKLERHISRVIGWDNEEHPEKMIVWVEPPANDAGNSAPSVEIWKDARGNKMCTFYGNSSQLSDFDIAFALAETVIRQYAQDKRLDFGGKRNPPLWLISALASEADISGENGKALAFFSAVKKSYPLKFSELVEPRSSGKSPDEDFRANAFLFYRFLRHQRLASWQRFSDLLEIIFAAPERAFPKKEKSSPDLLWATTFFATAERLPVETESPEDSQKRFENSLSFLVEIDGAERRISAQELIDHYELLGVKKIAYSRLRAIAEELPATNPVWHNAFTELGTFLEMIAFREKDSSDTKRSEERKSELLKQFQKVCEEQKTAQELQDEISDLLKSKSQTKNQ